MNFSAARSLIVACSSVLVSGCASDGPDRPLVFGQVINFGLTAGASVAEQGVGLTIGFKGLDIAYIPVTMRQPDGSEVPIGGSVENLSGDAYSVFGHFGGSAGQPVGGGAAKPTIGRFFATGGASRHLANGFAWKMGLRHPKRAEKCFGETPEKDVTTVPADLAHEVEKARQHALQTARDASLSKQAAKEAQAQAERALDAANRSVRIPRTAEETKLRPGQHMLFGQYDALGFDVTSLGTGADVTLGYKARSMAIVPLVYRNAAGQGTTMGQWALRNDGTIFRDSYSVLGRFEFTTDQKDSVYHAGLGTFFTTGHAAISLGDGFRYHLCGQYEDEPQPQPKDGQK